MEFAQRLANRHVTGTVSFGKTVDRYARAKWQRTGNDVADDPVAQWWSGLR